MDNHSGQPLWHLSLFGTFSCVRMYHVNRTTPALPNISLLCTQANSAGTHNPSLALPKLYWLSPWEHLAMKHHMTSYRVVWYWYLTSPTEALSDQAHCWAVHFKGRVPFSMGNYSVSLPHSSHTSLVIPHSTSSISYIFIYFIQTYFVVFRTKTTRLRKMSALLSKG